MHEQHYAPTEGEHFAVMWAIRHFYCYLHGNFFILETDHKALTYLLTSKNLSTKLTQYATELQEYDFDLRYRPGIAHANMDALSRLPRSAPQLDLPQDDLPPAPCLDSMHKRGTVDNNPTTSQLFTATASDGIYLISPSSQKDYLQADKLDTLSVYRMRSTPLGVDPNFKKGEETPDCPEEKVVYFPDPPNIIDLTTSHGPGQGIDEKDVGPPTDDAPPIEEGTACCTCATQDAPDRMLTCDQCSDGYHMESFDPLLDIIPSCKWYCNACDADGLVYGASTPDKHCGHHPRPCCTLLPRVRNIQP